MYQQNNQQQFQQFQPQNNKPNKPNSSFRITTIIIAIVFLGFTGYFSWQYLKKADNNIDEVAEKQKQVSENYREQFEDVKVEDPEFDSLKYFEESLGLTTKLEVEDYFSKRGMKYKDVKSQTEAEKILSKVKDKGEDIDFLDKKLEVKVNKQPSDKGLTILFAYGSQIKDGLTNKELNQKLKQIKQDWPMAEFIGYSLDGVETWSSYYSVLTTDKSISSKTGGITTAEEVPQIYAKQGNILYMDIMLRVLKGEPMLNYTTLEKVGEYK